MQKKVIVISLIALVIIVVFIYLFKESSVFKDILGSKGITEGVVEYDITYPKLDPNSMMASGMPSKAFLRFKDNCTSHEMSGMMGLISITYISNYTNKVVEQRLTLINKKYSSEINTGELDRLNNSYISSIEEGKKIVEIAGYKCKEALVKLIDGKILKIYYTNDISIDSPNWSNPYSKIEGVLMDCEMERYGVVMHLVAKSVVAQKVDDAVFTIPADTAQYKKIVFTELEKILKELNPDSN
jgi:hypothetical protein